DRPSIPCQAVRKTAKDSQIASQCRQATGSRRLSQMRKLQTTTAGTYMEDKLMSKQNSQKQFPPQHQSGQPGKQSAMTPEPVSIRDDYVAANKLQQRTALISGGDSGIGRAVALHFAREGANVAIIYKDEH